MAGKKTKIVLDADVINHFVRGGKLALLPKILPEFQFIVLDIVKKELPILILSELDSIICPSHPDANKTTGAVHSCGHHIQSATLPPPAFPL